MKSSRFLTVDLHDGILSERLSDKFKLVEKLQVALSALGKFIRFFYSNFKCRLLSNCVAFFRGTVIGRGKLFFRNRACECVGCGGGIHTSNHVSIRNREI